MSGLSEADRESLFYALGPWSNCDVDALAPAVEAIVIRAVNEALTEAADAIDGRWTRNIGGHPYSDRDRGLREAARIVRARTT